MASASGSVDGLEVEHGSAYALADSVDEDGGGAVNADKSEVLAIDRSRLDAFTLGSLS